MFTNLSLKVKLIVALSFTTLLALIVSGTVLVYVAGASGEKAITDQVKAQLSSINANKKNAIKLIVEAWPNQIAAQQTRGISTNAMEDYRDFLLNGVKSDKYTKYSKIINQFVEKQGYSDMFIIDNDGLIVYTASKESDYGTNILTGKFKNSGLGRVAKKASEGKAFQKYR